MGAILRGLGNIALLVAAAVAASPASAAERPVVAVYYAATGKAEAVRTIDPAAITHLIYAFGTLCGDHPSFGAGERSRRAAICVGRKPMEVVLPADAGHRQELQALTDLKRANPKLVLLVSVGGWGMPLYPEVVRTDAGRRTFARSAATLLRDNPNLDGIDLDWEYPGGGDNLRKLLAGRERGQEAERFRLLVKEVREAVDELGRARSRKYHVAAAIAGYPRSVAAVDWRRTQGFFDLLFVMSYDFTPEKAFMVRGDYSGGGGPPGHHTNLHATAQTGGYGADAMISNLARAGVPLAKMVLGVAFYGREWRDVQWDKGAFPAAASAGSFVGTPSDKALRARNLAREGFTAGYDEAAQAAYFSSPTGFISLDDPRSICAKGKWARAKGLAGLFAWEASQDEGRLLQVMAKAATSGCADGNRRGQ